MGAPRRAQRQPRPARRHVPQSYGEDAFADLFGRPVYRKQPERPVRRRRAVPKRHEPTLEEAIDATKLIQSAFRTHRVQKHDVIQNLKKLAESEQRVEDSVRRFNAKMSNGTVARTAEKTRMIYATLAEELTKEMIRMDQITTHNETIVRERRKCLIKDIQALLDKVDEELPAWQKLARKEHEEMLARAKEREMEEVRLRNIRFESEDDMSEESDHDEDYDVDMAESDDYDSELEDMDEDAVLEAAHHIHEQGEGMAQPEGETGECLMSDRAIEIRNRLQVLQEQARALENERDELIKELAACQEI